MSNQAVGTLPLSFQLPSAPFQESDEALEPFPIVSPRAPSTGASPDYHPTTPDTGSPVPEVRKIYRPSDASPDADTVDVNTIRDPATVELERRIGSQAPNIDHVSEHDDSENSEPVSSFSSFRSDSINYLCSS